MFLRDACNCQPEYSGTACESFPNACEDVATRQVIDGPSLQDSVGLCPPETPQW